MDFDLLLTLTDSDLKQIGVAALGPRYVQVNLGVLRVYTDCKVSFMEAGFLSEQESFQNEIMVGILISSLKKIRIFRDITWQTFFDRVKKGPYKR